MRIAVIDDEKYAREELIHQIITCLPEAEICEAASGLEAVELLEREKFDILFIDIHLCDMMGTTVASLARRLMPSGRSFLPLLLPNMAYRHLSLGYTITFSNRLIRRACSRF